MTTKTLACGCPTSSQLSRHAGGFGLRCSVHLPGCRIGAHSHPEARIVLPLQFGFDTRFGRSTIAVSASAAVFRPAGEEHEDSYYVPTTSLSLLLPIDGPAASLRDPFAVRDGAFPSVAHAFHREMATADAASPLVMEGLALLTTARVLPMRSGAALRVRGPEPLQSSIQAPVRSDTAPVSRAPPCPTGVGFHGATRSFRTLARRAMSSDASRTSPWASSRFMPRNFFSSACGVSVKPFSRRAT